MSGVGSVFPVKLVSAISFAKAHDWEEFCDRVGCVPVLKDGSSLECVVIDCTIFPNHLTVLTPISALQLL